MEKVKRKISRHYIDNMSIKNSFVFYALISLVIGIVIGVISITLVDDYRINLNYKYEDMTTRYDIPENGSFTAKYNKDQTEYTIYNASENNIRVTEKNKKELWLWRSKLQRQAILDCNNLLALIGLAHPLFHLKGKRVEYWSEQTLKVRNYIKKWRESDVDRYS